MKRLFPIALFALFSACPTYDSKLSGTFREVTDREDFSGEAKSVELFRFGDNVQALVRYYKTNADPFQRESRCVWSNSGPFEDKDTAFEIPLIDPRERLTIRGKFSNRDRVNFSFTPASADITPIEIPFDRVNDEPDDTCSTIPDALMTANFDFEGNEFADGLFEFENPVFVTLWLGVETIETGSFTTFTKTQKQGPWTRLGEGHMTDNKRGLRGVLHFFLPPPDEVVLTTSGTTRYSIGHFAVVEDSADDSGDFDFNIDQEPVAAASVRLGTIPDVSPDDTNNFGKAILFVEDDLFDLDEAMLNRMVGLETVENPLQHFFVVDIYGRNGDIKEVHFTQKPSVEINVLVTEDYLSATQIQLPRLIPFTQ